jgi:4-hydroxy-3-polyprenylbenzoate decarboxylase
MVIDATRKSGVRNPESGVRTDVDRIHHLKRIDPRIIDLNLVHDILLLVKVSGHGREIVEKLIRHTEVAGLKIVAAVSEDVNIKDRENYIWGIFTRFDCARDIMFTEQKLVGISPVYKGIMGIDATWKQGYPAPLVMTDDVVKRVDEKWEGLWR